MLPPNPNECNSTLTSGTRGIYPTLRICHARRRQSVQSSQCGHSQSVSGAQISNRKKLENQEDPRTQGGHSHIGSY